MTGKATVLTTETTRGSENRKYVRTLLEVRQPQFAAALESAVQQLVPDHETVSTGSEGIHDDR